MKINRIELVNFRNHTDTAFDLDNVNVFVGRNNAGKSSIKAAIEYALTGRCQWTDGAGRGAEALKRHGANVAGVTLNVDGLGQISRVVQGELQVGNWQGGSKLQQTELYQQLNAGADVIEALLNTSKFISMKPDEQKNMLFRLMGLNFTKDTILSALEKYLGGAGKADMMTACFFAYLNQWVDGAAGGPEVLDGIHKKVFTERTAAKKSLKELETLAGGGQQETSLPPGAWEAREQIKADLKNLKARKDELLQERGKALGTSERINRLGDQVRIISGQIENTRAFLKEVEFDQDTLDGLERGLEEQRARAEGAKQKLDMQRNLTANHQANLEAWTEARDRLVKKGDWTCPMVPGLNCAADKNEVARKVEKDIDAVAKLLEVAREEEALLDADWKKYTARYEFAKNRIEELKAARERKERLQVEINRFDKQLDDTKKELMEAENAVFDTEQIEAEIEQLSQRIEKGEDLVQKIAAEESVRKERARLAGALEKKRQEVAWLEALVEAFGPKGIKAQMLESVIGALQDLVNKRLEMLTAGRYSVQFSLDKGFEIMVTAGGVTMNLDNLSTSERMRVGIVLQDALNGLTGLRLMVIDDCEILDPENKQLLIGMLIQIKDAYDTIIVLSALGETVPRNPGIPGLSVYLVEDGSVRLIPAAQAA